MHDTTLLADIGGTNARFALGGDDRAAPLIAGSMRKYEVGEFASLADAARHYLHESGLDGEAIRPRRALFAVAGRVDRDEARITNHPWVISASRIRDALGLDSLELVNDFAAQSMALLLVTDQDVATIGGVGWSPPADGRDFNYAVIGPGTGLGVGALLRRDGRHHVLQSEGGHVSFAPGTPEEIEILQRLSDDFGRVSNERLVSGPGLLNLYRALDAIAGSHGGVAETARTHPVPRRPHDITTQALQGDPRCLRVIDVFCAVFGAAAGDLVLTLGAWDGVFLTGGLVPVLMPWLPRSGFRQRFEHKGRFAPAIARVPTIAVIHPEPGLLGAAVLAQQRRAAA